MKKNETNNLLSKLLVISLVIFLIGAIFRIQHYPYGNIIWMTGLASYFIISYLEIGRLRKIIAKLNKVE